MNRVLIKNLHDHIDERVTVAGWVDVRRDHGKLVFIDVRDRSGLVQTVAIPKHEAAHEAARELRPEWVVECTGVVQRRSEKTVHKEAAMGDIEIALTDIKVLSRAHELPFEKDADLNMDTRLDFIPLTHRSKQSRAIFAVQSEIVKAYRDFLFREDFVEIQVPKIVGGDAEGGAAAFEVEYFGKKAFLATSPQLYKQIMVGVFERVFTTTSVYRAEKHSTTRHINEYTSLDFEFGFIRDHTDVMDLKERLIKHILNHVKETCSEQCELLGAEIPEMRNPIPRTTLTEAQEILKNEYGVDCVGEPDLDPEHERLLSDYMKKKHESDFVFVTHYPVSKRPFYTYEDENNPGFTKSFDLLFRGLEITTGGQRIHDYARLKRNIETWGLDPEAFSFYLQAFKYGLPPEGGCATGLERLTAKLLNINNVKRATLFPRDINRIDMPLSK